MLEKVMEEQCQTVPVYESLIEWRDSKDFQLNKNCIIRDYEDESGEVHKFAIVEVISRGDHKALCNVMFSSCETHIELKL